MDIVEMERRLAAAHQRLDAQQADAMIAHRWFAEWFGEIMNGRDFAAKCPMASVKMQRLRDLIKALTSFAAP